MTLGDADFRKSPMKMIYRKLPKTASLPVTCYADLDLKVPIRRPFGEVDLRDQVGFKGLVAAAFVYLVLCAIVAVG